jgi:LuxR family maltose regulon positive regulatory protein
MTELDSIIRHAITPPDFEDNKVHRERLVDTIHANIPRKLIVIAAPAGYGKTTLLADFSKYTELPVCWIRLTEADRDVIRLSTVLAYSLRRRFRRLHDDIDIERLSGSSPEALARAFIDVIDAKVSETFVITLDDVHLINRSKPAMAFLDAFLENQPEQVTMIAAGREVIEVSLAKLMAESDLTGLGPHDLTFTNPEIISLTEARSGIKLTDEDAERLRENTRGWVTGVLLSTELAGKNIGAIMPDTRPMVYEYLASVILNRQPDDLRRFMLDTSVFPVMTVEGCNYLLKHEDSQQLLSRVVRRGTFITATQEEPRTYEYHPQFRQFLLETLAGSDNKRFRALHVRAADYLAEHDSAEYAVGLYCKAGATRKAASLADRRAQEMYRTGRWVTLKSWSQVLHDANAEAPRVYLYLAAYYTDQGNIALAEDALSQAEGIMKPSTSKKVRAYASIVKGHVFLRRDKISDAFTEAVNAERLLGRQGSRLLKAACLRLKSLLYSAQGELDVAEEHAIEAVNLLDRTDEKHNLASALVDLSNIQSTLGKFHEAHSCALRSHEIMQEIGGPLWLAFSTNNLAYDAHQQGQYEDALELYTEALKNARRAASPAREATILFGQADLFSDLDLALQAAELYGEGLNLAIQIDNIDLIRYGCIRTSMLHRRRGGSGLAHEWMKRAMALDEGDTYPPMLRIQLACLEAAVKPKQAMESLQQLIKEVANLDAEAVTYIRYYLARAALHAYELEAAQDELHEALEWAGGKGAEQVIAGELAFDPDFREFARRRIGGHPVLSSVVHRIDAMRAISEHYQEISEDAGQGERIGFYALGKSEIYHQERLLTDLKPLAKVVLFFLVDRQRVDRDVLLETFWLHHPPGRKVANLHTAIYSLRRELGKEAILHEGMLYSLNPDLSMEYDVARFERAASVAEGLPPGDPRRMFALTEAINSYGGRFLPDIGSDWVIERRRALEMKYLDLLAAHAEEALVRDQPLRAVNTLRQALQIDPYRDDTNIYFLEALGRLGRRSEIITHYQRYIRLLADELGLDPPEAVRDLYARLIN